MKAPQSKAVLFVSKLAGQLTVLGQRLLERVPAKLRIHAVLLVMLAPAVALAYWLAAPSGDLPASSATQLASSTDPAPSSTAMSADTLSAAPATAVQSIVKTVAAEVKPEPKPSWHTYTVASGDTLSGIFSEAGYGASLLHDVMQAGAQTAALTRLRPGDHLRFRESPEGELLAVSLDLDKLSTLTVKRGETAWTTNIKKVQPVKERFVKRGSVSGPLSSSMRSAGIPSQTVGDFISIFHWKVDFNRDMRPGAKFAVVYTGLMHDGDRVGVGHIQAASLINRGKTRTVYRFGDGHGGYNYYTADGKSIEPSILRTPLNYTRVSSSFSYNRYHPKLHIWRPHEGVDLAAPMGTPIHAAADGRVKYVGWVSGYGRVVELNNVGAYSTRYAHMSRYANGLSEGDKVHQGQIIGYVGESGVATGPHLHYEIRIHGKPYPPLKVDLPDNDPLPKKLMPAFKRSIQPLVAMLEGKQAVPGQQVAMVDSSSADDNPDVLSPAHK